LRGRRGAAIAARKRALRQWEESHPDADRDPDVFRREILPGLQGVRLSEIVEAAGISKAFASQVRAGSYTPHLSTWEALSALVKSVQPSSD
jgi:hypothetical protein